MNRYSMSSMVPQYILKQSALVRYTLSVIAIFFLLGYTYHGYLKFFVYKQSDHTVVVPLRQATQWWGPGKWAFSDITGMGLHWCRIPKCMSTMSQLVLCDLLKMYRKIPFDEGLGMRENDCVQKLWYQDAVDGEKAWETPVRNVDYAIVRDPLDRFVSLYDYMCQTRDLCSGKDVHTFAKGIYYMLQFGSRPPFLNETFIQDIRYHAQPQTWFCDIRIRPNDYHLVKHSKDRESMYRQLADVFTDAQIPQPYTERALKQVRLSMANESPTGDDDQAQIKLEILQNRITLDFVTKIYHYDYTLLGFTMPHQGENFIEEYRGHEKDDVSDGDDD